MFVIKCNLYHVLCTTTRLYPIANQDDKLIYYCDKCAPTGGLQKCDMCVGYEDPRMMNQCVQCKKSFCHDHYKFRMCKICLKKSTKCNCSGKNEVCWCQACEEAILEKKLAEIIQETKNE